MRWLCAFAYFLVFFYLTPDVSAQDEPDLPGQIEAALEAQIDRCIERYRGQDTGVLTVEDVCEVRAWALVGKQYPKQLRAALEAERQAHRFEGRINELRDQLTAEQEYSSRMAEKIGSLKGRPTTKQAALWGAGAATVGIAVGAILVAVLTGLSSGR